jgi:hypothetical protein
VADAGHVDEAGERYREVAAAGFGVRREPYAGATLANLAYLAALVGDDEGAATLYDQLEPWADRYSPVVVFQHVGAHELAMLAATTDRIDDAHRWFEQAVTAHEGAGAPLFVAETRLDWARVCIGVDEAAGVGDGAQLQEAVVGGRRAGRVEVGGELVDATLLVADGEEHAAVEPLGLGPAGFDAGRERLLGAALGLGEIAGQVGPRRTVEQHEPGE